MGTNGLSGASSETFQDHMFTLKIRVVSVTKLVTSKQGVKTLSTTVFQSHALPVSQVTRRQTAGMNLRRILSQN